MKTILFLATLLAVFASAVPAQARSLPCRPGPNVILLHGGGWQAGHPSNMQPWVDDFHAHGIQAKSIAYPFGSIIGAINYVERAVATECKPVILYGISAGGTIAAALAAQGKVAGGVNVVGPTDFTRWITPAGLYIMHQLRTNKAERYAASPYWRLSKPSPQLQQCGLLDTLVTYDQCLRYDRAARQSQPDTRLDALVNAHGQTATERAVARNWIKARWPDKSYLKKAVRR